MKLQLIVDKIAIPTNKIIFIYLIKLINYFLDYIKNIIKYEYIL